MKTILLSTTGALAILAIAASLTGGAQAQTGPGNVLRFDGSSNYCGVFRMDYVHYGGKMPA